MGVKGTMVDNKKVLEWAGFSYFDGWYYPPDGNRRERQHCDELPDMNFCFKWLVPKLDEYDRMEILMGWAYSVVSLEDEPALALCRAIEELIDETSS